MKRSTDYNHLIKLVMDTLCYIREIYQAISEFEIFFHQKYGISLNEGMLLCSLKNGSLPAGEIAKKLNLSQSNTSKVLKSVESKKLVKRTLGEKDRRQIYYLLTSTGKNTIDNIKCEKENMPSLLKCLVQNANNPKP